MIDVRKIGQRLTELRGLRSREEVARSLGVSTSALAMYELGYRMPKDDVKIKLAEFYDVSLDFLAGRTNNKKISR